MATTQLEWTAHELLESDPVETPLIAGGIRCHGGFDAGGAYVSPRTRNRVPAIEAWQQHHREQFGTPLVDIDLDTWPGHYPNVDQAKYLLGEGVREPIISVLSRIGTVGGFGSMIRYSVIPDLQRCFAEDVAGTAMSHLGRGLYEAHARDEAGHESQGGHKQMWFAARDIAFEHPVTEDETQFMLERMGITAAGGKRPGPIAVPPRVAPEIDADLELLIARMANLLLIELNAFHTFAWAESVLSDTALVAGDGEAARLVSYIRADEVPHVEYLKTTLSEMRDRTFVAESGEHLRGSDIIGRLWDVATRNSLGGRRRQLLDGTLAELEHTLRNHERRADILERFHELGSVRPGPDGEWIDKEAA
jgi:hypothetical protein